MEKVKKPIFEGKVWAERIKVTIISAILAALANMIYTWRLPNLEMVSFFEALPGVGIMVGIVFVSYLLYDLLKGVLPFQVPSILFVAIITTLLSFEGICGGFATYMIDNFNKIQLLPLCTPILSYAAISVGRDLDTFKKQGFAIICVALITFFGTYIGSTIIAEVVLRISGVI